MIQLGAQFSSHGANFITLEIGPLELSHGGFIWDHCLLENLPYK